MTLRTLARTLAISTLLLAWPSSADVGAEMVKEHGGTNRQCATFRLCDAEADVGACENAAGTETIVLDLFTRSQLSLNAEASTATTFSCLVYESSLGYHATQRQQLLATPLSTSQWTVKWSGLATRIWVECATVAGGLVTVDALTCKATE